MGDGVLAAVILPGALAVILLITASVMQARMYDAGIPSAGLPANSAVKDGQGGAASAKWRRAFAVVVPVRPSMANGAWVVLGLRPEMARPVLEPDPVEVTD